ncbi:MAG: hypothetical protein WC384_07575 [Prolixibacteraceae bacterium]|jgi:hypothetical protein
MDPLVSPSIKFVVDKIDENLKQISQIDREDVNAVKIYLDSAKLAIEGLGKEVQDILNTARTLNLGNKRESSNLIIRINKYLFSDNLRTLLNVKVIPGLDEMSKVFAKKADRVLQLPGNKQERKKITEEFVNQVEELKEYIHELQNESYWEYQESSGSKLRTGGSGMLMYDLKMILEIIEREDEITTRQNELHHLIRQTEENRSAVYKRWHELMAKFTKTDEQIRTKFR